MKIRTLIPSARSLALVFCLSMTYIGVVGQSPSPGQKLVGTWDVTLRFPVCSAVCPCPPGVTPNTSIPALHTYSSDGTMTEVSGGTLFRSAALGSWEHVRDQEYSARYAFFVFDHTTGARTSKEVVRSQIELQGRDAFEATATFDLFAADGVTPILTGCQLNITGTRF
jgi:hypothetical protein